MKDTDENIESVSELFPKSVGFMDCPFCGSNINEQKDKGFRSDVGTAYWVRCQSCRAEGPTAVHGTDQAKELWNTRATDQLLKEMANRLNNCLVLLEDYSGTNADMRMIERSIETLQKYREGTCQPEKK